jgi:hypothetical protein
MWSDHKMMSSVHVEILPDGRMTPENAAAYCGLAKQTMAQMRCTGNGPVFTKVGRRAFYFRSDLDAWIKARRFRSTGDNVIGGEA